MVRPTPPEFFHPEVSADHMVDYCPDAGHAGHQAPPPMMGLGKGEVDRWVDEQMFEEDVRAVLKMMRPNRREKLQGWNEYRTGGSHYRITVSWDDEFQITAGDTGTSAVPNLADVIETLLVGSGQGRRRADAGRRVRHLPAGRPRRLPAAPAAAGVLRVTRPVDALKTP